MEDSVRAECEQDVQVARFHGLFATRHFQNIPQTGRPRAAIAVLLPAVLKAQIRCQVR